jgi:hypothetical protein
VRLGKLEAGVEVMVVNEDCAMNPLALELDRIVGQLDAETAVLLERTVRDALALADRRTDRSDVEDALGYPAGYFAATAGSFADEPLEVPTEPPLPTRESW